MRRIASLAALRTTTVGGIIGGMSKFGRWPGRDEGAVVPKGRIKRRVQLLTRFARLRYSSRRYAGPSQASALWRRAANSKEHSFMVVFPSRSRAGPAGEARWPRSPDNGLRGSFLVRNSIQCSIRG